jgi:hypothetical protein
VSGLEGTEGWAAVALGDLSCVCRELVAMLRPTTERPPYGQERPIYTHSSQTEFYSRRHSTVSQPSVGPEGSSPHSQELSLS